MGLTQLVETGLQRVGPGRIVQPIQHLQNGLGNGVRVLLRHKSSHPRRGRGIGHHIPFGQNHR